MRSIQITTLCDQMSKIVISTFSVRFCANDSYILYFQELSIFAFFILNTMSILTLCCYTYFYLFVVDLGFECCELRCGCDVHHHHITITQAATLSRSSKYYILYFHVVNKAMLSVFDRAVHILACCTSSKRLKHISLLISHGNISNDCPDLSYKTPINFVCDLILRNS